MNNNLLLRILVWFVAIPFIFAVVYLLPEPNHLAFNLLAIGVSSVAAVEVAQFFSRRAGGYRASKVFVPIIGGLLPLLSLLEVFHLFRFDAIVFAIVAVTGLVLAAQVFRKNETEFQSILPVVSANLTLLIYPGLFVSYIVRLSSLPDATALILVFVCAVYFNDTMAYIAGRLFGRTSRGVLAVSPNKSLAGFIAGFAMSPAVILVAQLLRPTLFPGYLVTRLLFGGVLGVVVILGDLIESALKRSATMKDSGQIVPGRGGILDSVDSPIFAAPVFYYLYQVLFQS
ncbi:MAG TPA: phosphatidate cytidylyltransferase [Spirochaetia bacterium]|nr:phosphatidate cytidylyltransferase [Spirochaetia bacterium]